MMRAAGIDPGRVTGVVVLEVGDPPTLQRARWRAAEAFRPSERKGWTEVDRDLDLAERIGLFLAQHGVDLVVIEEAKEAKGAVFRGYRKQRTETAFRAGCYYQAALQAAGTWKRSRHVVTVLEDGTWPPPVAIHSYPAVTIGGSSSPHGWMGRSPRKVIVERIRHLALAVQAPPEIRQLDDAGELLLHHLGDALGVLCYHLSEQRLLRLASLAVS